MRKTALMVLIIIMIFGLCSCWKTDGSVPEKFKGKWEMCGIVPEGAEMSSANIIERRDSSSPKSTVEFPENGNGMIPYTNGSIPEYSTESIIRVNDNEVCYEIEIMKLNSKGLYEKPDKMKVHAKIKDDYLFVWEEHTNAEDNDVCYVYKM